MATSAAGSLFFCPTALCAQGTAPSPAASSPASKKKTGHVRLWNLVFFQPAGLDLVLGSGPDGRILQSATTANFYANYDALPLGRCTLNVYRTGDRQTPLKSFDLNVVDRSYYTINVQHFPGGQLTVELIDDTPDPATPPSNRLTVRQVSFISHGMVVSIGGQQTAPLEPGGSQTLTDLPKGLVPLQARTTTPGSFKSCNGEVDFGVARHATLFMVSDAHRILRLRVAPTGPSLAEEAEDAAPAKSNP